MGFMSPRNRARGSIKPSYSFVGCTVAFWPVAVFPVPRTLSATWSAFGKITIPVTLIHTAGPTRVSRECTTHHAVVHDASSVRAGPVLAFALSALRGYAMRQGLTGDKLRNL